MRQSKPQQNDSRPTRNRPWHPSVGFVDSWVGFAPHHELAGILGYQEPTWAMGRAIVAAVSSANPRDVAHI